MFSIKWNITESEDLLCARIGNTVSGWLTIKVGVWQGFLLGPFLFLIFINYLVNLFGSFQPISYTHDTTLLFTNYSAKTLISQCNYCSIIFQSWNISDKIFIIEEKTFYMAVTSRALDCCNQTRLNKKTLVFKYQCTFLGNCIENKLKLNIHSDYIASKVSKLIGISLRLK